MLGTIIIAIIAVVSGWFGWKNKVKDGLIASVAIPALISAVIAVAIPVPAPDDVGGIWIFIVSFVVLTGISLFSFGVALLIRRIWFQNKVEKNSGIYLS